MCTLCRGLPAELAAATRLTSLVLSDPSHTQLDVNNALPCSLQHLRLTESAFEQVPKNDSAWDPTTRDFGSLNRLQSLQLTARVWAQHRLPLG
jgi:hypothetical protein